jgi:hypothetical protein
MPRGNIHVLPQASSVVISAEHIDMKKPLVYCGVQKALSYPVPGVSMRETTSSPPMIQRLVEDLVHLQSPAEKLQTCHEPIRDSSSALVSPLIVKTWHIHQANEATTNIAEVGYSEASSQQHAGDLSIVNERSSCSRDEFVRMTGSDVSCNVANDIRSLRLRAVRPCRSCTHAGRSR